MSNVIVIGGGHSLKKHKVDNLLDRGFVIGVNDAATHARVHAAVTMDRLWLEHRIETMEFLNVPVHYREGICKNCPPPRLGYAFKNNNSMDEGMTLDVGRLNGDNSGACALNLAFQRLPYCIYLLGFDMMNGPRGEKHFYPDYEWQKGNGTSDGKFRIWKDEFAPWVKQFAGSGIEVKNVTDCSALDAWPKISFKQFLQETA